MSSFRKYKNYLLTILLVSMFSLKMEGQCKPGNSTGDKFTGAYTEFYGHLLMDKNLVNDMDFTVSFGILLIFSEDDDGKDTSVAIVVNHLREYLNETIKTVGVPKIEKGGKLYFELSNGEIIKFTAFDQTQNVKPLLREAVRYTDVGYYSIDQSMPLRDLVNKLIQNDILTFRLLLSPNKKVEEKVKKKYMKTLRDQMECFHENYLK